MDGAAGRQIILSRCIHLHGGVATSTPQFGCDLSWVAEAFDRVAGHLDALTERTQKITHGGYLVSTSDGPILDQLPAGPVDELAVCAPFHDPGAQTLRALVNRLQPRLLRISYQPELTELDGPAVAALVIERDAELRSDAEPRYRHGKLIEWAVGGTRYALTGSPNLSGAALRHSVQEGGNCELGVIAPVSTSLLPEGSVVAATALHTKRFQVRRPAHSGPLLLGATCVEHGLHIVCARKLTAAGHLELSLAASPPETWERAGEIAAGVGEVTLTVPADGGSRVRLVITADDGTSYYSNFVFVVDPERVTRRPGITTTQTSTGPEARTLFDDPRLAEKFFADLDTLRSSQSLQQPHSATAGGRDDAAPAHAADHVDSWEGYLDECAGRVGHPLLRFALGIPAVPAASGRAFEASVPVSWADELVSDKEIGLQSDKIEDAANQDDHSAELPTSLIVSEWPRPKSGTAIKDGQRSSPTLLAACRHQHECWSSDYSYGRPPPAHGITTTAVGSVCCHGHCKPFLAPNCQPKPNLKSAALQLSRSAFSERRSPAMRTRPRPWRTKAPRALSRI